MTSFPRFSLLSKRENPGNETGSDSAVEQQKALRLFSVSYSSHTTHQPPPSNELALYQELQAPKRTGLRLLCLIDLVTVFDAILTSRQTCGKLPCLYENLMSNNFLKTAVLKKNMNQVVN